jgi:7-carboxy-7-deazaguanine synthase
MPILLNTQPPEKQTLFSDGGLYVHSWFSTIQGEGPFAGRPAIFLRLAGCNLQCSRCDTEYTTRSCISVKEIFLHLTEEYKAKQLGKLIVITGGEPFRQNLAPLVNLLVKEGVEVQIETNGTLFVPGLPYSKYLTVICSPKTGTINAHLRSFITALKYVLDADHVDPDDGLPTHTLGQTCALHKPWKGFSGEIYLQPLDEKDEEKNKRNIQAVLDSCMKFNYRLSFQLHKLVGLE